MRTDAQRRAQNKWEYANTKVLQTKVRSEQADKYRSAAARAGTTVSAVMRKALDKLLEEYPETGDSYTPQATDTDT